MTELKRTPFHDPLDALGGRFVDFHGWRLPVQFEGIPAEHRHVREKVGVFDVSHMGEIEVRGPQAVAAVDHIVTNAVAALADGEALYTPVCLPTGGIVDDLIVYRRAADDLFICCNASNREKDVRWFEEQAAPFDCVVRDRSDGFGQLAVQGPLAPEVIARAFPEHAAELTALPPFRHRTVRVGGAAVLVATTGYTGEKGFELYIPVDVASEVWDRVISSGAGVDLRPIGLGARDTLRLEMRYCLYGNDIDETTSPLEAGLGWTVKLDKPAFVGREALLAQKEAGLSRRLVGFKMVDRGIPREGYALHADDDPARIIGRVTSGTHSPTLGEPIGLGYVDEPHHKRGRELRVDIRGQLRRAKVVRTPFVEH